MSKPQIITTPGGEEIVFLGKADYDALVERADRSTPLHGGEPYSDDEEDAALARLASAALARLAVGDQVRFPSELVAALGRGDNAVRVFREWRGLTQGALAAAVGTDQGTISALEAGRRRGPAPLLKAIAACLAVPLDLVVPDGVRRSAG